MIVATTGARQRAPYFIGIIIYYTGLGAMLFHRRRISMYLHGINQHAYACGKSTYEKAFVRIISIFFRTGNNAPIRDDTPTIFYLRTGARSCHTMIPQILPIYIRL